MKIKTGTVIWIIVGFIWSIFMGVIAISLGFGSAFPSMNYIAKPFVCPNGQMQVQYQNYQVSPVESGSVITWYCVDAQSGYKMELNPFVINVYAGLFYGVVLFLVVLIIWYFYSRWDPSKESEKTKQRIALIQTIAVIVIIVGVTAFGLMPFFRGLMATPEPIPTSNATATLLAATYEAADSGRPSDFSSSATPLADWDGIPIMPQAVDGHQENPITYKFNVPVDSGTIESYYQKTLPSQGWTLADDQSLAMKFTKDQSVVLVTLSPASDLKSWVVTLILVQ